MSDLLLRTTALGSSFDEQDSYVFLAAMQKEPWQLYSSKNYPLDVIVELIDNYIRLQASVDLSHMGMPKFWSPDPVGSFRYVMDKDESFLPYFSYKPVEGFLVQGSYWSNGFYYLVSNQDFLLEANLFIDLQTKLDYNYP
jgi:hypothetical protein